MTQTHCIRKLSGSVILYAYVGIGIGWRVANQLTIWGHQIQIKFECSKLFSSTTHVNHRSITTKKTFYLATQRPQERLLVYSIYRENLSDTDTGRHVRLNTYICTHNASPVHHHIFIFKLEPQINQRAWLSDKSRGFNIQLVGSHLQYPIPVKYKIPISIARGGHSCSLPPRTLITEICQRGCTKAALQNHKHSI